MGVKVGGKQIEGVWGKENVGTCERQSDGKKLIMRISMNFSFSNKYYQNGHIEVDEAHTKQMRCEYSLIEIP